LPVFDEQGQPIHRRGVVEREPGLYFIGLHYLYAMSSTMIQGIARDSEYIGRAIARRTSDHRRARVSTALGVSTGTELSPR
jgi:putative flavoprotein involved in K+ transport